MTKLKPCPFCSSIPPDVERWETTSEYENYWQIECTYCGCTTAKCKSSEAVTKRWNTRNIEPVRSEILTLLQDLNVELTADVYKWHSEAERLEYIETLLTDMFNLLENDD